MISLEELAEWKRLNSLGGDINYHHLGAFMVEHADEIIAIISRWQAYRKHPDWKDVGLLLAMTPEHVDFDMDAWIRTEMPKP
jgi:hypothetical protein